MTAPPIGTDEELIERLRKIPPAAIAMWHGDYHNDPSAYDLELGALVKEAADALVSRIAEVDSLKRALQLLAFAVERRWPNSDFTTSEHFAEPMNQARVALSQHGKV